MDKLIKSNIILENFKIYLLQGKYIKAEEICKNIDNNSIKDMIMNIAYETENICVYSFTQYMIQRTKKIYWIELAIGLMLHPHYQ